MRKRVVGKLKSNDNADGFVELEKWFEEENALYRADVLQDILAQVTILYNGAVRSIMLDKKKGQVK